jgi:hypothetical protein
MREVRFALLQSPTAGGQASLARKVRRALAAVEAAAGEAGLTPAALPAASLQAYRYLASLDLGAQRTGETTADESPPPIRVGHLVRARDRWLSHLADIAEGRRPASVDRLRERMADLVAEVAIVCERAGVSPATLPDPSRRAYQWMSFLVEPDNLEAHLRAQRAAAAVDRRVRVALFHLSGLYRFAWKGDSVHLMLSEAFLDAPRSVLESAVKLTIPYTRKRDHRRVVRTYGTGPEFERRLYELETVGGSFLETPRGVAYDLEQVFSAINHAHFEGKLTRPRLGWWSTTSLREFGHYVQATDLVLISSQLDSQDVPSFVVEHVVHHELLHRHLGARVEGGRRIVHSRAFRLAEKGFPRYKEADAFLESFAKG